MNDAFRIHQTTVQAPPRDGGEKKFGYVQGRLVLNLEEKIRKNVVR